MQVLDTEVKNYIFKFFCDIFIDGCTVNICESKIVNGNVLNIEVVKKEKRENSFK